MAKSDAGMNGDFHIQLDSAKLEAFLVFKGGTENDKQWSLQDISALFLAANVLGVKADDVAKAIEPHQRKPPAEFSLSMARGTPPTPPKPESLALGDFPVPEAWSALIKEQLGKASPPEILIEVSEKVETEQTIQKKGPLPFLPAKTETVKVQEKVVHQERLAVDAQVLGHAYTAQAQRIGTITPGKPGTNGKTVTGELILAANLEDPIFHVGQHITRKGLEIHAELPGIIRWGVNWLDLIPFADHAWELALSADKATCFLDFKPGSPALPAPSVTQIIKTAQEKGFHPQELISFDELGALIKESIELQKPLHHSLSQAKDASFEIVVSEDKMKAVLNAEKGSGHGKPLVLKELGKAITESGLKFSKDKIKADIPAWFNGAEKNLVGYVLAEGTAPKQAPSQSASYTATFLEGKELEALKATVKAVSLPENAAAFPLEKLSAVARVTKDQRVLTLGPLGNGSPGSDVYGEPVPASPGMGYDLHLSGRLEKMGASLVVATCAGLLLQAEENGKTWLCCIEHLDAELIIELAEGNMAAFITINAHRGSGKPAGRTEILAEINKLGIKRGLEMEILDRVIQSSEQEKDVQHVCFARGQAAQAGGAGELTWKIEFASGQAVTLRQDGTADFRNQKRITTVKKDAVIAEIKPIDLQPVAGWDVLGKELPAPAQASLPVEPGQNIRKQVEPDGTTLLIAELEGELRRDKNRIDIISAYVLKNNVDSSSGNIKFPGVVQVGGDVLAGFYIMAGGEIQIAGSVEAALLSSDADIIIQGGVKGGGKAMLRTKKNIMASFIEQATVMVVGDLLIKKALLRSKVKCNGKIQLPDDAKLIGGEIRTKMGLVAGTLGNPSGVPTRIIFGQDVLIEDQIETEEKEIAVLQADMAKLATALASAERLHDDKKKQELFAEKVRLMKLMEKRNLRLFTLKERSEQHFESEVIVRGTIHPGVVIESHGRTLEFNKPGSAAKFSFDTSTGRICEHPLS